LDSPNKPDWPCPLGYLNFLCSLHRSRLFLCMVFALERRFCQSWSACGQAVQDSLLPARTCAAVCCVSWWLHFFTGFPLLPKPLYTCTMRSSTATSACCAIRSPRSQLTHPVVLDCDSPTISQCIISVWNKYEKRKTWPLGALLRTVHEQRQSTPGLDRMFLRQIPPHAARKLATRSLRHIHWPSVAPLCQVHPGQGDLGAFPGQGKHATTPATTTRTHQPSRPLAGVKESPQREPAPRRTRCSTTRTNTQQLTSWA
jgi:hypothetical protein